MPPADRLARIEAALAQRLAHVHVAMESFYHRHNVSAALRSCDAVGIQHVHLLFDGKFVPSHGPSRGVARWLSLHHYDEAQPVVDGIRARGQKLYVCDFAEDAYTPSTLPIDEPFCLWFGTELQGVSPAVREQADGVMMIPMRGLAQSLNVSVSVAVALFEVTRRVREQFADEALLSPEERQGLHDAWVGREHTLDAAMAERVTLDSADS